MSARPPAGAEPASGRSDDLADRWPLEGAYDLRDALLAAYADPSRRYHDTRHLAEVLDRLDDLGNSDLAVLLAAWFHDGVYDGERDDEERSAVWAETALSGLVDSDTVESGLVTSDAVAEVARLVRMTTTHRPEPGDRAGALLSDADLAILAAQPERYAEYADAVRAEYDHFDDAAFTSGRIAVLTDLLAAPTLFHTIRGRELWEATARANVRAELLRLGQDVPES